MKQPGWLGLIVSLGAVTFALILGAIVLMLVGGDPIRAYAFMAKAAFGNIGVFSDTLVKATPLILVSLAAVVAFRMRLWNIGAEGQFYLGAFGASLVVLTPILPPETSPWLMIPAMMVMGMLAGALWGFIPGYLKAKYNVNEIISTLMMNYIAVAWNNYFIFAVWSEGGFQMSRQFPKTAWLPRLTDYASQVPMFRGLTIHLGFVIALIAAGVVWWIMYRSRWGYEIRLIGDNPRAARYAGINIDAFRCTGGIGRHVGDIWSCTPPAGGDILRLRLHGDHHRLAGETQPYFGRSDFDPLRGAAPSWSGDPTIRYSNAHPRDHPRLSDWK